jgi:pSer/pThr/pTyr-binding forkhead associated (FHA) protein
MQTCPHCGQENLEGVVFCQKCGVALVAVPITTRQFDDSTAVGTDELFLDDALVLQANGDVPPIVVQIRREVILGRVTDQADQITFINLTPYEAEEAGVSRRHARLLRDNRAVYLSDLNSTNGTKLNGEPLAAGLEKRVRDGDEILLGKLKLFVYFQRQHPKD